MSWLDAVQTEYANLGKQISHRPDLADRVHIYSSHGDLAAAEMNVYVDYATVYGVYVWVQKALQRIIENIVALPFGVADSEGKIIETHPISQLFANVNDSDTPDIFWSSYLIHKFLGGESFIEIVPDSRGRPSEVWSRRPDLVDVVPDIARRNYPRALGYIFNGEDDEPISIDAPWMVQDAFYNPLSPWRGLAPIRAAREDITIDLFGQAYSKNFLKNSARPDFAIIAPEGITQSEKDALLANFRRKHQGSDKWHEPYVLERGITDIKPFSFPPKDIEWLEQRRYSRDAIGAIFGVPDEIMGYGRDTYENFDTAMTVFWTLTLRPITWRRDVIFTNHFQQQGWLRANERLATDLTGVGVLQEDLAPKVEMANRFWGMGVPFNTLDERLQLGIGPIPGGDVGYLGIGVQPADSVPIQMDSDEGAGIAADTPDTPDTPQVRVIEMPRPLLTDGVRNSAKRQLKRMIQKRQNEHLRDIRKGISQDSYLRMDWRELETWLGDGALETWWTLNWYVDRITGGDHDTVNKAYNYLKTDAILDRILEVSAPDFFSQKRLLQLDPDDEDAEWRIRQSLERGTARSLHRAFIDMMETLVPTGSAEMDPNEIAAEIQQNARANQALIDAAQRAILEASDLGVNVAIAQFENVGLAFDWTLVNTLARETALQHAGTLIAQIDTTTLRGVREATSRWIENGEPLETLIRDLEPLFGRQRAELIASTEITQAFATANQVAYRETGVVQEIEWRTANDERVCPICGPLHGTRDSLENPDFDGNGIPPAHPACRCWISPVIEE